MKDKLEVFQLFIQVYHIIQTQFENSIKHLHSDNDKKYVNNHYLNLSKSTGIIYKLTCVFTPQQNGVVERIFFFHFLEVTKALFIRMFVPSSY